MNRKNLFLLASCQCLTLSSTSLMMTTSALVGMLRFHAIQSERRV
jgi:hypothetical protein